MKTLLLIVCTVVTTLFLLNVVRNNSGGLKTGCWIFNDKGHYAEGTLT